MTPGPLIIVSGPAGSGKSTLIRRVLAEETRPLRLAVSAAPSSNTPWSTASTFTARRAARWTATGSGGSA